MPSQTHCRLWPARARRGRQATPGSGKEHRPARRVRRRSPLPQIRARAAARGSRRPETTVRWLSAQQTVHEGNVLVRAPRPRRGCGEAVGAIELGPLQAHVTLLLRPVLRFAPFERDRGFEADVAAKLVRTVAGFLGFAGSRTQLLQGQLAAPARTAIGPCSACRAAGTLACAACATAAGAGAPTAQIGRASCRERGESAVVDGGRRIETNYGH